METEASERGRQRQSMSRAMESWSWFLSFFPSFPLSFSLLSSSVYVTRSHNYSLSVSLVGFRFHAVTVFLGFTLSLSLPLSLSLSLSLYLSVGLPEVLRKSYFR